MTKAEIFQKFWRGGGYNIQFFTDAKTKRTGIILVRPPHADQYLTLPEFRAFLREGNQALTAWEGREK